VASGKAKAKLAQFVHTTRQLQPSNP